MADRQIWEEIAKFESYDYVKNYSIRTHGRQFKSDKIREVNSCFKQGKEYFSSASLASNSVKPLLLYYGVIAISRGAILLLDVSKREANLKPSHGLQAYDWGATLAGGIKNILDVKVKATQGTFSEFCSSIRNSDATTVWSLPSLTQGWFSNCYPEPKFLTDDSSITLGDITDRDFRLSADYTNITGRRSKVHICHIIEDLPNGKATVNLVPTADLTGVNIAEAFGLDPSVSLVQQQVTRRGFAVPNIEFTVTGSDHNDIRSKMPANTYERGDFIEIAESYSNSDKYCRTYSTFLLSYILGMIVRYYPTAWISLLNNDSGDAAQPVLLAAMRAVEREFPVLLVNNLS